LLSDSGNAAASLANEIGRVGYWLPVGAGHKLMHLADRLSKMDPDLPCPLTQDGKETNADRRTGPASEISGIAY
jgi:hypothetical protein